MFGGVTTETFATAPTAMSLGAVGYHEDLQRTCTFRLQACSPGRFASSCRLSGKRITVPFAESNFHSREAVEPSIVIFEPSLGRTVVRIISRPGHSVRMT